MGTACLSPGPTACQHLPARELAVLRLLAAGKSDQRIARDLVVALDMVKTHVTHVLGKLGAANRTQAVARTRPGPDPVIPPRSRPGSTFG
jgi:LuxR family maltose regulon positive regulatory protein